MRRRCGSRYCSFRPPRRCCCRAAGRQGCSARSGSPTACFYSRRRRPNWWRRRSGPGSFRVEALPFRTLKNEQHLILPLISQFTEVQGLLSVSCAKNRREALDEALPLLELLANQAAAAIENNALYSTLEQRVEDTTATIENARAELQIARDRAETLYRIVRTLAVSLDEREVLTQALMLVAQATEA